MQLELRGKTAVVTGASKGIGRAVAGALGAEGCALHLVSRNQAVLEQAANEIHTQHGVAVQVHALDLARSADAARLLERTGPADILINNAGAIPAGDLLAVDETRWRVAWDLKVFGYINLARSYYAAMREKKRGVIVNVTGLAADRLDAGYIAGSTGNAALNAFSRTLGGVSLEDGVRVLAVSPGAVATDRIVTLLRHRASERFGDPERWQDLLRSLPQGRAATVEEVADVVVFAASARASYLSGIVINVDGGHSARTPVLG